MQIRHFKYKFQVDTARDAAARLAADAEEGRRVEG